MPSGLRNTLATFQHLMNLVVDGVEGCAVYWEVVYSNEWGTHLLHLQEVFDCLAKAQLTVNLPNCEFAKATAWRSRVGRRSGQCAPCEGKCPGY